MHGWDLDRGDLALRMTAHGPSDRSEAAWAAALVGRFAGRTGAAIVPTIIAPATTSRDRGDRAARGGSSDPPVTIRTVTEPPAAAEHDAPHGAEPTDPCPWCGARGLLLWVRWHVQCGACGQVVESCCEGPAGCA